MLRRLGCACCETEESYELDTSPVNEKRKKEPGPPVGFADNQAFNTDTRTPDNPNTSVEKQRDNLNSATAAESEVKSHTFPDNQTVLEDFKLAQLTAVPQTQIPEIVINESSTNDGDGDCEIKVPINTSPVVLQTSCQILSSDQEEPSTKMADNVIPKITLPAPEFRGQAVVNGVFKEISLSDYKGKYVVFFFYPLDFTFVCPTEIIAFSDRAEDFRKIGCEVVACSTDSHFCHLAWVNTPRKQGGLGQMDIPLLSDKNCAIAKSYGVYKEDEGVTFRGLFIIDDKGNLRQVTVNDLPVGRSVDETIRLVQAFQFTDKHGEVCPAGWKPGQKTMKADPAGSKEYFASKN